MLDLFTRYGHSFKFYLFSGFLTEDYKNCLFCFREQVGSTPENLFTHPSVCNYSVIGDIIIRSYYDGETQKTSHVLSFIFPL